LNLFCEILHLNIASVPEPPSDSVASTLLKWICGFYHLRKLNYDQHQNKRRLVAIKKMV